MLMHKKQVKTFLCLLVTEMYLKNCLFSDSFHHSYRIHRIDILGIMFNSPYQYAEFTRYALFII